MSGPGESREETARRLLDEAIGEAFRPFGRRGGSVRVVVTDSEDGREVDVDHARPVQRIIASER